MSDTIIEPDAAAAHAPGTDIARYSASVPEEYRARFVMRPEEAKELDRQLRECMRAVLVEGVDYGTIPGMGKTPSLFKPGAEKLLQWFGFGFENRRDEIERDTDGRRIGVTYRCTVFKELADGRRVTVATGEGYAGYDEDKFYISAEDARRKAEEKERKYAAKDDRQPKPEKWENATEYRAPWNSVLKMAHKRALVGAAIDATAAAGLFTQDLEDMKGAVPDGGAFIDAAETKIMALPDETRNALGRWYRDKKWPDPGRWTPEQWCAALITAGTLTARPAGAQPESRPQAPVPEVNTAGEPEPPAQPSTSAFWNADNAMTAAMNAPDRDTCVQLWRESAAAANTGKCSAEDARRIQDVLKARMEDLREEAAEREARARGAQQPAVTLDPEDPWAPAVDGIATASDAERVTGELLEEFKAGRIDETRANIIRSAISARAAQVADVIEGKVAA